MGYSFFLSRIFDVEVRSEIGSGEVVEKVQALPRSIHLHSGSDAPLNVTFIRAPPGTLLKVDIPLVFIRDDVSPGLKKVIGIKDPIRPGVREAVQTCQAVEITVRMVTGDNISTAKVIAKECGIFTEGGLAIEGSQFRDLPLHEMRAIIPKILVMARSLPLDKHTLVNNLRKIGEVVAVTGDGTKDAPALHEADIGLAMGIAGTEVAKENADVIIMDDNFKTIVNVARWGRAVYINIQKFVQFQLTVNVVALIINFVSACITENPDLQGKSGLLGFPPQSYLSEIDGANFGSHRC